MNVPNMQIARQQALSLLFKRKPNVRDLEGLHDKKVECHPVSSPSGSHLDAESYLYRYCVDRSCLILSRLSFSLVMRFGLILSTKCNSVHYFLLHLVFLSSFFLSLSFVNHVPTGKVRNPSWSWRCRLRATSLLRRS